MDVSRRPAQATRRRDSLKRMLDLERQTQIDRIRRPRQGAPKTESPKDDELDLSGYAAIVRARLANSFSPTSPADSLAATSPSAQEAAPQVPPRRSSRTLETEPDDKDKGTRNWFETTPPGSDDSDAASSICHSPSWSRYRFDQMTKRPVAGKKEGTLRSWIQKESTTAGSITTTATTTTATNLSKDEAKAEPRKRAKLTKAPPLSRGFQKTRSSSVPPESRGLFRRRQSADAAGSADCPELGRNRSDSIGDKIRRSFEVTRISMPPSSGFIGGIKLDRERQAVLEAAGHMEATVKEPNEVSSETPLDAKEPLPEPPTYHPLEHTKKPPLEPPKYHPLEQPKDHAPDINDSAADLGTASLSHRRQSGGVLLQASPSTPVDDTFETLPDSRSEGALLNQREPVRWVRQQSPLSRMAASLMSTSLSSSCLDHRPQSLPIATTWSASDLLGTDLLVLPPKLTEVSRLARYDGPATPRPRDLKAEHSGQLRAARRPQTPEGRRGVGAPHKRQDGRPVSMVSFVPGPDDNLGRVRQGQRPVSDGCYKSPPRLQSVFGTRPGSPSPAMSFLEPRPQSRRAVTTPPDIWRGEGGVLLPNMRPLQSPPSMSMSPPSMSPPNTHPRSMSPPMNPSLLNPSLPSSSSESSLRRRSASPRSSTGTRGFFSFMDSSTFLEESSTQSSLAEKQEGRPESRMEEGGLGENVLGKDRVLGKSVVEDGNEGIPEWRLGGTLNAKPIKRPCGSPDANSYKMTLDSTPDEAKSLKMALDSTSPTNSYKMALANTPSTNSYKMALDSAPDEAKEWPLESKTTSQSPTLKSDSPSTTTVSTLATSSRPSTAFRPNPLPRLDTRTHDSSDLAPPIPMRAMGRPHSSQSIQTTPLAKMFVECCGCRFFHDMPARIYECMAGGEQVVQSHAAGGVPVHGTVATAVRCHWCTHGMTTACCRGYAAMVYLQERLH